MVRVGVAERGLVSKSDEIMSGYEHQASTDTTTL